jgi:hypothetical protein
VTAASAAYDWRAAITGMRAACTTAELTEPSSIPANPGTPMAADHDKLR